MIILDKHPHWINKDTGINIKLYVTRINATTCSSPEKLICWAYGHYLPVKSNGYRGNNYVSSWRSHDRKIFTKHIFYMQPLLISSLNKILKKNQQKTISTSLLWHFVDNKVTSINYPLKFQAYVIKSKKFGHIFTFLKPRKIIRRINDWNTFQASLPGPNQPNNHNPQNNGPEL